MYGLPELHREQIRGASLVAAPGCYPTAAVLAARKSLKQQKRERREGHRMCSPLLRRFTVYHLWRLFSPIDYSNQTVTDDCSVAQEDARRMQMFLE